MIPTTSRIANDLPIILDLYVILFYSFAKNQSNKSNKFIDKLLFDNFFIQKRAKNTYRKNHKCTKNKNY